MKNKIIILIIIILIAGICFYFNNKNQTQNNEINLVNEDKLQVLVNNESSIINNEFSMVIIKNNIIENENLIDDFIEKAIDTNMEEQELNIKQDNTFIKVKYTPGEYAKAYNSNRNQEDGIIVPSSDGSFESNKNVYGYFTLIVDEELKGEYPLGLHTIQRITSENNVTLYFYAPLIDYSTIPEICKYNLDSSNYSKKFDLNYIQRKDLGIKDIYDMDDYSIKTLGGDVDIIIEDDMVYHLEEALNNKVITPNDILEQVKTDLKYGICQNAYYSDGGSVEYMYNDYTILKLNTLEDEKDLIIGMSGQIINIYNKNK